MDFIKPNEKGFTIYSKSGCPNCSKVKILLNNENIIFKMIDCDDYLIENKDFFLECIKDICKKEYKMFPIVFNDGILLGGYNETKEYIDKLFLSFDEKI
jgi:glutaredoxin